MRLYERKIQILLWGVLLTITACGESQQTGDVIAQTTQSTTGYPAAGSADGAAAATTASTPTVESAYAVDGSAGATTAAATPTPTGNMSANEALLLSDTYQLVTDGLRSGEGYFRGDGKYFIYQSEVAGSNPFYQIYLRDLATGATSKVSPGIGLTTCSWVHPSLEKIMFASTHEDPDAEQKQAEEIAMRASGVERAYAWDYDQHYEIYQSNFDGSELVNLTNSPGYDAEGSYSSDGSKILFASNREAYQRPLSSAEQGLFEDDSSYFMDLYIMDADGGNLKQLTFSPGYDGGPFFSADDQSIVWRRFNPDGNSAEIWTMDVDGGNSRQLTAEAMVSWGPYFHPSGDYIIYSSNVLGHANFELFIVDVNGQQEPVRVTNTDGTDILPVFSPDGTQLAWSSTRTSDGSSQIYMANWNDETARRLLGIE